MRQILIAVGIALAVSILLTPMLIRLFTRQGFGHEIREDGPPSHQTKRGTPSMGGVAILAGIWAGYLGTHLAGLAFDGEGPSASGLLVLGLATVLGGVGFLDDLIKIRSTRNLGLNKTAKTVGQITAAVLFGVLVLQFHNANGLTPASANLSYVRDIATVALGSGGFSCSFCVVIVSAWSNAVNFTDGLDGLAAGCMAMVLGAYVIITFWQYRNACVDQSRTLGCYNVRDPLDLALSSRPRPRARASDSCGGMPRRPRSSWATPDRWRWAASSRACRSPAAPRCWRWCWVRCSSPRSARWWCRSWLSAPPVAGCSGWRRSTIISSWAAGPKPR